MPNQSILRNACLVALGTLSVCSFLPQSFAGPARKNLVIIQTDEHHFGTLGCYGGTIVETKNIDWIARNGALCQRFYATTPVCSPSRASLMSGLYPQKTPVVTNNIPLSDSIVTFAELLRRQGYQTGYAGKWHLDGNGKPQWAPKRQFGFTDNRFMFNRGHWKKFLDTTMGPRIGSRNAKGEPNYGVEGADETSFSTDWLCTKAIDFIHKNSDRPFCYMISIPDPHGPNTVRAPYDTMYQHIEVPIPATLKKPREQTPAWGRSANVTPAQLRRLMPPYYGMVKCIDDNVGRVLDALREENILDQTIIVFTSDHGDLCGEHGRLNKGVPYEGSARIPFLIHCPDKIKAGTVTDEALSCVDFLPTIMDLLDVPYDITVDGRNAAPLLTGQARSWEDICFLRSTPNNPWLAVTTHQYKLVYSSIETPWFIDVNHDPQERINLFEQPVHQDRIRELTQKLREYCLKHNDPYARIPRIHASISEVLDGASEEARE
jgi:arylsulfatase A-like enzyme